MRHQAGRDDACGAQLAHAWRPAPASRRCRPSRRRLRRPCRPPSARHPPSTPATRARRRRCRAGDAHRREIAAQRGGDGGRRHQPGVCDADDHLDAFPGQRLCQLARQAGKPLPVDLLDAITMGIVIAVSCCHLHRCGVRCAKPPRYEWHKGHQRDRIRVAAGSAMDISLRLQELVGTICALVRPPTATAARPAATLAGSRSRRRSPGTLSA